MKIKNLMILALAMLTAAIAQPALSTLPYYCVYNYSGHHLSLYTSKTLMCNQPPCYWACSGQVIGVVFPTFYSVRVTAGLPVYLCLQPPWSQSGTVVSVGNVSTDPINANAGTTLIITADPSNRSNYVQVSRVCSGAKNFQTCMATGYAPIQNFQNLQSCPCGPAGCG